MFCVVVAGFVGRKWPTIMELLCSVSLMADALRWRSCPSVGGDTHVMTATGSDQSIANLCHVEGESPAKLLPRGSPCHTVFISVYLLLFLCAYRKRDQKIYCVVNNGTHELRLWLLSMCCLFRSLSDFRHLSNIKGAVEHQVCRLPLRIAIVFTVLIHRGNCKEQ